MKRFYLASLATFIIVFGCKCKNESNDENNDANNTTTATPPPATINYNIVNAFPHDTSSYTQGLIWADNTLIEGTGLVGESKLLKVDLKTGKAQKAQPIDPTVFGEGITILNGKIYQLTWQDHKVYVYDAATFKKLDELSWDREGWGITHNGKDLIISTGDSNLYFVDPETFKIKSQVGVTDNNGPVASLNELEYVDGMVYANLYTSDYIVRIDPASGRIVGKMDLSGLLNKSGKPYNPETTDVLNGIAYDSTKKSFYITGKKWPAVFEVKLN
ncbi:MAG: glutaminyl-peptide cyclotransferase [Segetibacter sp.]|nr:glutaminyl-peptide cyclotransferase [Segetibacter sp.]